MVDVLVRDQHDVSLLGETGRVQRGLPRTVVARREERVAEDRWPASRVAQSEASLAEPPQFNRQPAQSIVAAAATPGRSSAAAGTRFAFTAANTEVRREMSIIAWIVLGLIAGWLAGTIMRGGGYGIVGDGVLGAIVGGWLTGMLLGRDMVNGFNIETLIVAVIGAIVLIAISRLFTGSR